MAGRLRHAEMAAAELRDEIKKRDATIQQLRVELSKQIRGNAAGAGLDEPCAGARGFPVLAGGGGAKGSADASMLLESNQKLREMMRRADAECKDALRENFAMKTFLKDYGLTWVGDADKNSRPSRSCSTSPEGSPSKALEQVAAGDEGPREKKQAKEFFMNGGDWVVPGNENGIGDLNAQGGVEALGTPFEPAQILSNVKKLNHIAGEGQKEVVAGADGIRRLREKCVVAYLFYKDGIWARGGPLRPYSVRESKVLVRDLMDGFFPWELKDEYPEGVPLKVDMRLDESKGRGGGGAGGGGAGGDAHGGEHFTAFKGAGQALGKDDGANVAVDGVTEAGRREVWAPPIGASKGETLFRRLPERVVKNGNVIDVKADIQRMLGAASQEAAGGGGGVRVEKVETGGEGGGVQRAELRIKCVGGERVLELLLPFTTTIADLHQHIRKHLGSVKRFKIRSSFPAKEYGDDSVTLEETGLTPNALLFLTEK